jgi:hypothetical protein
MKNSHTLLQCEKKIRERKDRNNYTMYIKRVIIIIWRHNMKYKKKNMASAESEGELS